VVLTGCKPAMTLECAPKPGWLCPCGNAALLPEFRCVAPLLTNRVQVRDGTVRVWVCGHTGQAGRGLRSGGRPIDADWRR
jgi:hypothetical protein